MANDSTTRPTFVHAAEVPPHQAASLYPRVFWPRIEGRVRRRLGNVFGLTNFGVNLTTMESGAETALRHAHSLQDELVYVLTGTPTLVTNDGEFELGPGDCAGFKAGTGNAHHLVNRTEAEVVLLEIGDRTKGCVAEYPDDDVRMQIDGGVISFTKKDGSEY